MAYVLVIHEVEDYERWVEAFDAATDFREESGELSCQLFRTAGRPNEITGLFEWDEMENARRFFSTPELAERMKEAGVVGRPRIMFLEEG